LVLADDLIDTPHLSSEIIDSTPSDATRVASLDLRERVDALETELLMQALEQTGGNQARAADMLGLSRFGLQKMMKRLGLGTAIRAVSLRRGLGPAAS
jgi:transcriptional regulator with GAF, ATPase, and Fis domain